MFRTLTKREGNIFALCIIVVLIYAGYRIVIKPLRRENALVEIGIQKEKKNLIKNLRVLAVQKNYKGRYVKYLSKFKQDQNNDEVMSLILSEIQQVGGKLNLRISELKPIKVKKEQYFNRFSVSLIIDSTFVDIIRFIYKLQSKPYLFKVEEFRFDKSSRRKEQTMKTHLILSRVLVQKDN